MLNINKIITLLLVLGVPLAAFIYLKQAEQEGFHHLKKYGIKSVDSVKEDGRMTYDTTFHKVPDFSFTDQTGKTFSSAQLKGKIWVADFFFTSCPTICLKMSAHLEKVQKSVMEDSLVKIVSVSVDPKHDSVKVLREYADNHDAVDSIWHFLTGNKDSIYKLAKEGFFLVASHDGTGPMTIIHSDKFVMVDWEGHIRGYYTGTDQKEVKKMIRELNFLRTEYAIEHGQVKEEL